MTFFGGFQKGVMTLLPHRNTGLGRVGNHVPGPLSLMFSSGIQTVSPSLRWERGLRSEPGRPDEVGPGDTEGTCLASLVGGFCFPLREEHVPCHSIYCMCTTPGIHHDESSYSGLVLVSRGDGIAAVPFP